jgi:hypothetical protein
VVGDGGRRKRRSPSFPSGLRIEMIEYREFEIVYNPPSIPVRSFDWQFAHRDYDGPEDNRSGHAKSLADVKEMIDEMVE